MRSTLAVAVAATLLVAATALPDLILDQVRLASSISLTNQAFSTSSCAYQEGCVTGTGLRRLLKFDTATPNIGTTDLHIGPPSSTFEYDYCHGHWHYKGYAEYRLFDQNGAEATRGRKQAFCLMDSGRYYGFTGTPGPGGHHCGNQGISVGWQDVYYSGLDCQWIDITDVPNGVYTLQIELNAADPVTGVRKVQELRYDNNVYRISVTVTGSSVGGGGASCTVGQWSAWNQCTATCGGGVRQRSRTATGFDCPTTTEEVACNTHSCGDGSGSIPISTDGKCGNNSPVGAACPGVQCCSQYGWCGTGTAYCTNSQIPTGPGGDGDDDAGAGGGVIDDDDSGTGGGGGGGSGAMCANCWPGTSGPCKGANGVCYDYYVGTTMCPGLTSQCGVVDPDRDCEVDVWSAWGSCSVPCDGGTQTRRRDVLMPPYGGGAPCPSPLEESRSCNTQPCPDDNPGGDIDCAVSDWGLWGECSVSCGGGEAVRRRTVVVAPRGDGTLCPTLEEKRPCNPEACPDHSKCSNCFPGTSGPCQSYNGVCWQTYDWNGVASCPSGTSYCASVGSVQPDDAVVFSLTVGGVTPEEYIDAAETIKEKLAEQLRVIPQSIKVSSVSGSVVVEGDDHTAGRRLHGGHAPTPGQPSTTLTVEILAPQRYGEAKAASEISSDVQKTVGDGLLQRVLSDAGIDVAFTQIDPAEVKVQSYGEATATTSGSAAGVGSAGLTTMGIAIVATCAAVFGALVAALVAVAVSRKRKSAPGPTKSFTRVAIAPRRLASDRTMTSRH